MTERSLRLARHLTLPVIGIVVGVAALAYGILWHATWVFMAGIVGLGLNGIGVVRTLQKELDDEG